jgi:cell division septation protein DedD
MDIVQRFVRAPIFWIILAVVVLILGGVGVGIYQYQKVASELTAVKNNPAQGGQLTDDRQRELIAEVSSKIMLPADEKPTVAIVSDINRLKDQQFFVNGQNGDVVLIYMNSKRAILYRPAEKKIVEVAPVNLSPNQTASVAGTTQTAVNPPAGGPTGTTTLKTTPAVTPTAAPMTSTFSLRNGTQVTGLARSFQTQLLAKYPLAQVTETGNAANRNTASTLLVDVKGSSAGTALQIAQALGIQIGTLPPGETAPAADFLIIIGADKK